jgi:hypothetical protein
MIRKKYFPLCDDKEDTVVLSCLRVDNPNDGEECK